MPVVRVAICRQISETNTQFWLDGSRDLKSYCMQHQMLVRLGHSLKPCLFKIQMANSINPSADRLPESLQPLAKRQKLDIHGMHSSGGKLAQLTALSDSMSSHEHKLSTAACVLKELFHLPAFCSEARPLESLPFDMYT